jgi:hypothetical protein
MQRILSSCPRSFSITSCEEGGREGGKKGGREDDGRRRKKG